MTICYIDAFSGLAGDMLLGALADAGADTHAISRALDSFALGATIEWDRVQRRGISATKFRVGVNQPSKHRHLSGILKLIHAADLPDSAKAKAERVFRVLGEAEAAVHAIPLDGCAEGEGIESARDGAGVCSGVGEGAQQHISGKSGERVDVTDCHEYSSLGDGRGCILVKA